MGALLRPSGHLLHLCRGFSAFTNRGKIVIHIKNTADLREFLVTEMQSVAEGKRTPQAAKAITSLAQQIHNSLRLEMDMARFISSNLTAEKVNTTCVTPLALSR
jgi:hypothetical protein